MVVKSLMDNFMVNKRAKLGVSTTHTLRLSKFVINCYLFKGTSLYS